MMLRDFGEGDVEATITIVVPSRKGKSSAASKKDNPDRAEANRNRAHSRARTTIRRTIMAGKLDHLLTLTYRENKQDERETWRDFTKFVRVLKDELAGRPWPYIAVQEFQKRGAVHFHVAVCGFQDVPLLRRLWHRIIGGRDRGNIDVQHFVGPKSQLAKYLAKYLSKETATKHGNGTHRYKRSRGIHVPGKVSLLPNDADLSEELLTRFKKSGAEIKFQKNALTDGAPGWLWACSW